MIKLLIIGGIVVLSLALAAFGVVYFCCVISGTQAQHEEDAGIQRRS